MTAILTRSLDARLRAVTVLGPATPPPGVNADGRRARWLHVLLPEGRAIVVLESRVRLHTPSPP